MLISQLIEISNIDSEIVELHARLESLYERRADITGVKDTVSSAGSIANDDINLDGIDLSL